MKVSELPSSPANMISGDVVVGIRYLGDGEFEDVRFAYEQLPTTEGLPVVLKVVNGLIN
jgi:uncharacterized protein YcsI (UPF0317 family)